MPKLPKQRRFIARSTPLGPVAGAEEEEIDPRAYKGGLDFDIVEKLTSGQAKDREQGCNLLAALNLEDKATAQSLVQRDIPRIVAGLLSDMDINVKTAAVGAISNFGGCGPEACIFLAQLGVTTHLVGIIQKAMAAASVAQAATSDSSAGLEQAHSLIYNSTACLVSLMEESDQALHEALSNNFVAVTLNILSYPPERNGDIILIAAHALNVMTDGEDKAVTQVRSTAGAAEGLVRLVNSSEHPFDVRVVCSGVILSCATEEMAEEALRMVLPILSSALDFDSNAECMRVVAEIMSEPEMEVDKLKEGESETIDLRQKAPESLVQWQNKANIVGSALEILTNAAYQVQEVEEVDDEEWEDADEVDAAAGVTHTVEEDKTIKSIVESGVLAKVLLHTQGSDPGLANDNVKVRVGVEHLGVLRHIQLAALSCCSNLFGSALTAANEGELLGLWGRLGGLYQSALEVQDADLLEGVTSTMGAVARALQKFNTTGLTVNQQFLESVAKVCLSNQWSSSARVNAISILAVVGKMNQDQQINRALGQCILDCCDKQDDMRCFLEAVNALFELYGEENFDGNFKEIGGSSRLENIYNQMKAGASAFKKSCKDRALKGHFQDSLVNLRRFIKYKREHGV